MSAYRKLVSSESIALLAALCIAAIFVGSHYQRRMDNQDQQALQVAQQVHQLLSKLAAPAPAAAPGQGEQTLSRPSAAPLGAGPARITLPGLKALGLNDPAPIEVKVLDPSPTAWKVAVEHPQGVKRYLVTPHGVTQEVR